MYEIGACLCTSCWQSKMCMRLEHAFVLPAGNLISSFSPPPASPHSPCFVFFLVFCVFSSVLLDPSVSSWSSTCLFLSSSSSSSRHGRVERSCWPETDAVPYGAWSTAKVMIIRMKQNHSANQSRTYSRNLIHCSGH